MSDYKNKILDMMSDPVLKGAQQELADFITKEYKDFDSIDFIGSDLGGFVKVYYRYSEKGFYKVEIDNEAFDDKAFLEGIIPSAINNALLKYAEESKQVEARIKVKETELYNRILELAKTKSAVDVGPQLVSPKKTYLN